MKLQRSNSGLQEVALIRGVWTCTPASTDDDFRQHQPVDAEAHSCTAVMRLEGIVCSIAPTDAGCGAVCQSAGSAVFKGNHLTEVESVTHAYLGARCAWSDTGSSEATHISKRGRLLMSAFSAQLVKGRFCTT